MEPMNNFEAMALSIAYAALFTATDALRGRKFSYSLLIFNLVAGMVATWLCAKSFEWQQVQP